MAVTANLGYPRLGAKRELKWALEGYWSGKIGAVDLLKTGKELRLAHWRIQQKAGIDIIPSNDFSFYDQVLDTTCMVSAIPQRYSRLENSTNLDLYFAMARGTQQGSLNLPAMEMTKWFDTNYHYIVPEIEKDQVFRFASAQVIDEFIEAKAVGIHTRPVLMGPVSYLLLSKSSSPDGVPLDTLPGLISVYIEILQRLSTAGADWVQIDEPCLVLDLDEKTRVAYSNVYNQLSQAVDIRLMVATYFGSLGENLSLAAHLPVAGLHIDLVRAPQQLENILTVLPAEKILSMGVVDGRNVWRNDLDATLTHIQQAVSALGTDRIQIAPSCSLMFSPHDLSLETELDAELHSWLAFAHQKLDELAALKQAADGEFKTATGAFSTSRAAAKSRRQSPRTHNLQVRRQLNAVDRSMLQRDHEYKLRKSAQAEKFSLPLLPTTTIGSFPRPLKYAFCVLPKTRAA